jgi:hypothetical protein
MPKQKVPELEFLVAEEQAILGVIIVVVLVLALALTWLTP